MYQAMIKKTDLKDKLHQGHLCPKIEPKNVNI